MAIPIRQNTASQEISLGYFLDSNDGNTEEIGLTIANTDIKLWKRGATTLANKNSGGATHISNGLYYCVLDATDTDTLGGMVVFVHVAGALAVRVECEVMTANRFDALVLGTDTLHADVTQCGGSAVAAGAIPNAAADAAGGLPISDAGGLDLDTLLNGLHSTPHCATSGTVNIGTTTTGSYADTCVNDSNYWNVTHAGAAGDIDFQFAFNIGANRIATWVTLEFAAGTASGALNIYAYNYLSNSWDQLNYDSLTVQGIVSRDRYEFLLLQDHVNPYYYGDGGDVLIRIVSIGHSAGSPIYTYFCNVHSIDASLATNGKQLSAWGKLDVNAECDSALSDYDSPTNTEMGDAFTEIKGATWAAGTDTLEHIRNKQTDIETDTGEIGTAGVGLTDLGGMSTGMMAEVESEANDALVALKLDHLIAIADADDVVDDSVIAKMAATGGDWSTFAKATDSLQAIRDRGDAAWDTATGFSTHSAADVKTAIEAAGSHLALILDDTGTAGVAVATASKTGYALSSTGADLILKDSTFALAMADAIWDEVLTGALHNIVNSAGRRVREIGAYAIESGTAQDGALHSITLAATASATDGAYNRNMIILTDNTGVGQTRTIVDYNGTTKVAIIDRDWRTTPDATSTYQVTPDNTALVVDQGVAQAGTATTIKLRAYASAVDDTYLCNIIAIIAGTGRGQTRLVGSYDGTSKIVTICGDNWVTTPDATSVYAMMPYGTTCTSCIGTHALGQINTECDTVITDMDRTGFSLSDAGVDAILDENVDGTHTLREILRLVGAYTAGKSSGGGTATVTFRDLDDTKDRIVATVTSVGNRTAVTLTED